MTKDQFVSKIAEYNKAGFAYIWSIDDDVVASTEVIDESYQPAANDVDKVHLWQRANPVTGKVHSYGGLRLWPTDRDYSTMTSKQWRQNQLKNLQYVREIGSTYKPYDIAFISYHDQRAFEKHKELSERFPNLIWIEGVEGIFEAHKAAAEKATSEMFWVIDSDAKLMPEFDFSYVPDAYDQETTHVWKSINPVTDDQYGWGGIKLFNRSQVLNSTSWGLDFTTGLSKSFKLVDEVSNISEFNTSGEDAWRSAFREAAKLTLKEDAESKQRLERWLEPANTSADFYEDCKGGALAGHNYAIEHGGRPLRMKRINDYGWLHQEYLKWISGE
jgi:hypothetical protein